MRYPISQTCLVSILLVSCGGFSAGLAPVPVLQSLAPEMRIAPVDARTVEEFDTTTAGERIAAVQAANDAGETLLGTTVASLGNATKGGFWLETPLVSVPQKGRVHYGPSGKSVALDLLPVDGLVSGGSRLSLAAMRPLEVPLTGLVQVAVYLN